MFYLPKMAIHVLFLPQGWSSIKEKKDSILKQSIRTQHWCDWCSHNYEQKNISQVQCDFYELDIC